MAIGAEIAPAHPALVRTVRIGTELRRGVDLAVAPPRGHEARWRGGRWLGVRGTTVRTGVARRFVGEARKGCGLTGVLGPWGWGGQWCRARGGVARPRPLEHNPQPDECDQRELVEEQRRYHGNTPSYTC